MKTRSKQAECMKSYKCTGTNNILVNFEADKLQEMHSAQAALV